MSRYLHRLLRRLLPSDFRAKHGRAMEDVFVEAMSLAARRGIGAAVRLVWRETLDLARTGARLRAERRWARRPRPVMRAAGGGAVGILDDVRWAARWLVRRPSTTAFAAVTVALGVGSTTAIFSALEGVILNPLPYENGDRMLSFFNRMGSSSMVWFTPSAEQLEGLEAHTDLLEHIEPWAMDYRTLTGVGEARQVDVARIRPSFHELVGRDPLLGRTFASDELDGEGARVLLLDHGLWAEALGSDPGVVGRTLTLDGEPWTVIGVMPPRTVLIGWGMVTADLWAPLAHGSETRSSVTAMLRPDVDVATLNLRLAEAAQRDALAGGAGGSGVAGTTLEGRLTRELVGGTFGDTLTILMVAVVLLLLIACANVSNLLLASAHARRRETAVRSALGAGRGRLVRQLLVESFLLALIGGALGVGLAFAGQEAILTLRPDRFSALDTATINVRVLLFALALTVGAGMLFGLVPAWQSSRPGALESLRSGTRAGADVSSGRFSWALVSGEVALSFALLLGALLVLSSLARLTTSDPGFRAGEVVVADLALPSWKYEAEEAGAIYGELAQRLHGLTDVTAVSRSSGVPGAAGIWFGALRVEGEEADEETSVIHGPGIDAGYFAALGQPLLTGRGPTEEEVLSDAPVVVVGEGMVRRTFGEPDPVGRRFAFGSDGEWHTVIGVTVDVPMSGLSATSDELQGYFPSSRPSLRGWLTIRVRTGTDPAALLPLVRAAVLEADPEIRVDRLTVASDLLRDTLDRERFTMTIIGAFAVMALVLAAVGLYGLLAQVVGQRVREIGIRMALGAGRRSVRRLVLGRAAAATALGVGAGIVLAIGGTRVLESRIFGLDEAGPGPFALAAAVLMGTSLLAAYLPARRATRVDPTEAMRAD